MLDNMCLCGMEGGKMSYQETSKNEVVFMFTAWLEKLLHYAKLDYIKKEKDRFYVISIDVIPEFRLSYEPSFKSKQEKFENEKLEDAFLSLTETRKNVVYLSFIEGLSAGEISKRLNLNTDNVRKIKERALAELRAILLSGEQNE